MSNSPLHRKGPGDLTASKKQTKQKSKNSRGLIRGAFRVVQYAASSVNGHPYHLALWDLGLGEPGQVIPAATARAASAIQCLSLTREGREQGKRHAFTASDLPYLGLKKHRCF